MVVCLLQIKTGLVPPSSQAEQRTPTLSRLTEPTHVILQNGSDVTSTDPQNKAFFAPFSSPEKQRDDPRSLYVYRQKISNVTNTYYIIIQTKIQSFTDIHEGSFKLSLWKESVLTKMMTHF